ncbi:amidohydrolase family protein, partial [candidate division KSB3 bacterium]|nr:amidohydrolase family protein [candidate division KSB3 bacterium]MBD3324860.1 amidohydrolase family protein [candidate division KSB3 bacterium]
HEPVLDLAGHTILPGLMDAHVHLMFSGGPDPTAIQQYSDPLLTLIAAQNASKTLQAGFTTVRDTGARGFVDIALRTAIEQGMIQGPRLFVSGHFICMTGGHGSTFGARQADGVAECRKAAREQLRAGVDVVKVMATGGVLTEGTEPGAAQLSEEELRAAIEEAHKAGKITSAHAHGTQGIKNALRAGIDSIEHGTYADEVALEMMREQGVFLAICIGATRAPILKAASNPDIPAYIVQKNTAVLDHQLATLKTAYEMGINVVLGTDSGTPSNEHGHNAEELEIFVEQGIPPMDAIIASTSRVAKLLKIEDRLGTLEAGKLADVVVVQRDPLSNIAALKAPLYVIKDGVIVKHPHDEKGLK